MWVAIHVAPKGESSFWVPKEHKKCHSSKTKCKKIKGNLFLSVLFRLVE